MEQLGNSSCNDIHWTLVIMRFSITQIWLYVVEVTDPDFSGTDHVHVPYAVVRPTK